MPPTTTNSNLIKSLLAVAPKHCDNCGSKYTEDNFKIVRNSPASTVLHLKCNNCNSSYMINVMNPLSGMIGSQRTPVNIDLQTGQEIQEFAGKDAVSTDEAIDTYNDLDPNTNKETLLKLLNSKF